jgi:cold-inducible RNA-binding protein
VGSPNGFFFQLSSAFNHPVHNSGVSDMFSKLGQVESVQIITDRDTGRSKGFGFVQMSDDKAAEKAIAELNGKEVNGRKLTVNEARPMEKKNFGGGGRRDRY